MRKEECEYSQFVIHPGHGRKYVPFAFISTKPVLTFARKKCIVWYLRKTNPRDVAWTKTYRRLHKKTATDRVVRRRVAKTSKVPRAIVGADLAQIQEIRNRNTKEDRSAKGKAVKAELAERKAGAKAGKVAAAPKAAKK
jgi:large subunit ribosomal protein L24e